MTSGTPGTPSASSNIKYCSLDPPPGSLQSPGPNVPRDPRRTGREVELEAGWAAACIQDGQPLPQLPADLIVYCGQRS